MNIIKPEFEIIEQQYGDDLLKDMYKHIEICGRNCYKSEDKITDDSYIKFVGNLEKANHGAMLEHGTIYLVIGIGSPAGDYDYFWKTDIVNFFKSNKYSKVKEINDLYFSTYYITTNWRVIYENQDTLLCKAFFENYSIEKETLKNSVLEFIKPPRENHEKRYTVKFTCDIGVTREFNRHRVNSPAEESTRYCNYSKDKFGQELNVCEPCWFTEDEIKYLNDPALQLSIQELSGYIAKKDDDIFNVIDYWRFANLACEYSYMNLIRLGWTAQQARTVLPLDTKSTLIHTAFVSDWKHFFDLRAIGTTGAPHPSAKELAEPLMNEFIEKKFI